MLCLERSIDLLEGKADPLINPSQFNPQIPRNFSYFLLKSLELKRENRFDSASAMRTALQPMLELMKKVERETQKALEDPKVREAATAMGMTDGQRLMMVEIPLAMPVMLTGIRVAIVISVGVATVAAAVGAGGLGTYIFRGLRQNDNNLILAGALASALFALFYSWA